MKEIEHSPSTSVDRDNTPSIYMVRHGERIGKVEINICMQYH